MISPTAVWITLALVTMGILVWKYCKTVSQVNNVNKKKADDYFVVLLVCVVVIVFWTVIFVMGADFVQNVFKMGQILTNFFGIIGVIINAMLIGLFFAESATFGVNISEE